MNDQERVLNKRLEDFLSGNKYESYEKVFGQISDPDIKKQIKSMWIMCYAVLTLLFSEFNNIVASDSDLLTKFIANFDILLFYLTGKHDGYPNENLILECVKNFSNALSEYYGSMEKKQEVKFYFKYYLIKDDKIINEQFFVNFDKNRDNFIFFDDRLKQLLGDQMVRFSFTDFEFLPDLELKIICKQPVGEEGPSVYYLEMRGKEVCQIGVNSASSPYTIEFLKPNKASLQPLFLISETAAVSEIIVVRLDGVDKDGCILASEFKRIEAGSLNTFIKTMGATEVLYLNTLSDGGTEEYFVKHDKLVEISPSVRDSLKIGALSKSGDFSTQLPIKTFMRFCFPVPPVGGFYDALSSPLSDAGKEQLNTLIDYILALHEICKNQTVYAPFTSLIQSSGFGKTKLCLETLQHFPGAYVVFRRPKDTGIPVMSSWMEEFRHFIISAPTDLFPAFNEKKAGEVPFMDSSMGRFLFAIYVIIKTYFELFEQLFAEFQAKNHNMDTIKGAVIRLIGQQFMKEPSSTNSLFNPNFEISVPSFKTVNDAISNISNVLIAFKAKHPSVLEDNSFAFLLFFDELELMTDQLIKPGRVSAVNIVRRGLHLLDSQISVLGIAVGTSSDALDFSPAIKDNSCRILNRTNLLSPLPLSGSFDLLSKLIEYHKVSLSCKDLRNRALFNVLVSFGRALWSSCKLNSVVEIAMGKIKNGDNTCFGSRMALLLMRADVSVNTHHVLARNLIRSYMSIVSYISTDVQDIKIGYSSEPVLAMAARALLKEKVVRSESLYALKEYLERGAVDKGRIIETLFEYITLFAIDDATTSIEYCNDPETVPREFLKLTRCKSHILEIVEEPQTTAAEIEKQVLKDFEGKMKKNYAQVQAQERTPTPLAKVEFESSVKYLKIDYSDAKKKHYSVKSVSDYLKTLVGSARFESIAKMIDPNLLEGIVNCSHFLQLEKIREGDFGKLENAPKPASMRKNVIDKALLTYGIQRQCGFVMPPNYFGIDFIVPFAFESSDQSRRTIYSFIAVQSKTSKENIYECAAKMSINLHFQVCINSAHTHTIVENACSSREDYWEICESQISVLMIAEEPASKSVTSSLTLALRDSASAISKLTSAVASTTLTTASPAGTPMDIDSPTPPKRQRSVTAPKPPIVIGAETWKLFEKELLNASKLKAPPGDDWSTVVGTEDLPPVFSVNYSVQPVPSAVLTKIVDSHLSVVQFLWDYTKNDSNDVAAKYFLPPPTKLKAAKKSKQSEETSTPPTTAATTSEPAAIASEPATILPTASSSPVPSPAALEPGNPSRRVGTCIVCYGVSAFAHLLDSEGVKLMKYILDFEKSNFHNVDNLHLPIVQNSLLNGKACPYYEANPTLRGMRNLPLLPNPTVGFKEHYSVYTWEQSVAACSIGPVDSKVPSRQIVYHEKDPFELGHYLNEESEEEESSD